ncbi:MAG: response regulator [Acidobacteriota bacterium]
MSLSHIPATDLTLPIMSNLPGEGKEKILIVDDSPTVRLSFTRQLSQRYECSQADSFMDALDRLRERDFGVVIADIHMPRISGVELLRKVVENTGKPQSSWSGESIALK